MMRSHVHKRTSGFRARKKYTTRSAIATRHVPDGLYRALCSGADVYLSANDKARMECTCKGLRRGLLRASEAAVLAVPTRFRLTINRLPAYNRLAKDQSADVNIHAEGLYTPLCAVGRLLNREPKSAFTKKMDVMTRLITRGACFGLLRYAETALSNIPRLSAWSVVEAIIREKGVTREFPYIAHPGDEAYTELIAAAWLVSSNVASGSLSRELLKRSCRPDIRYFDLNPLVHAMATDNAHAFRHMTRAGFDKHSLRSNDIPKGLLSAAIAMRAYAIVRWIIKKLPEQMVLMDKWSRVPCEGADTMMPRPLRVHLLRLTFLSLITQTATMRAKREELSAQLEQAMRDGHDVRARMLRTRETSHRVRCALVLAAKVRVRGIYARCGGNPE